MSQAPVRTLHAVPNNEKITIEHELKHRFKSELYKIEQPYVQISQEGYVIKAADDSETYSASRPRHIFKTLFARALGVATFFLIFGFAVFKIGSYGGAAEGLSPSDSTAVLLWAFGGFLGAILGAWIVSTVASPIRRATVKDHAENVIMTIEPTSRFLLFNSEFAIRDTNGHVLATFEKDFWESLFQRNWHAYDFQRKYLFSAVEDNLILSVLRRYLNLAKLIPMQFRFNKGGGKPFGEFRRGYSLRDKYKLTYNPAAADGWLVVAASILLDTGENR